MTKSFQKSANNLQELLLVHPGIISPEAFNKHFQLHCYEPSVDLAPFLVHIWIQRQCQPHRPPHKSPVEILSGPNVYLFFTTEAAFIHGITRRTFTYDALASPVIAGVKFRPGGFYPFFQRPVSELHGNLPSLLSVFPDADEGFTNGLLNQSDETIVARIEALLRSKQPDLDKNIELIAKIVHVIDSNTSLRTVRAVAQFFQISERSLQLLFQKYVGIGPKWVITRKRLLEAIARMHGQFSPSWAKVAAELGYSSQSHFTREFTQIIGQSPSQYLKSLD